MAVFFLSLSRPTFSWLHFWSEYFGDGFHTLPVIKHQKGKFDPIVSNWVQVNYIDGLLLSKTWSHPEYCLILKLFGLPGPIFLTVTFSIKSSNWMFYEQWINTSHLWWLDTRKELTRQLKKNNRCTMTSRAQLLSTHHANLTNLTHPKDAPLGRKWSNVATFGCKVFCPIYCYIWCAVSNTGTTRKSPIWYTHTTIELSMPFSTQTKKGSNFSSIIAGSNDNNVAAEMYICAYTQHKNIYIGFSSNVY